MWQAIETAPKDGTLVLLCVAECYMPTSGCWATYHPNATGKACWRTQPVCGDKLNPTHWQALPPAPGAEQSPDARDAGDYDEEWAFEREAQQRRVARSTGSDEPW